MAKYIKLDIEKLYEKLRDRIHECIFDGNVECDDCPFCGVFNCGMMEWLESLETIEVNEDTISNGAISSDYIEGYREAVRRLEKFYLGEANAPSVAPTERREK